MISGTRDSMPEWTRYRIKVPEHNVPSTRDGQQLKNVYHVVHLSEARRILEDGNLRAGLIYDESKLQRSRICVTWLSANTWAMGSIYGNVQFTFPWAKQIRSRRLYWVEAMTGYRPHAYRILLTDRDLSESKHVREYDPSSSKGPLRERDGKWYWNNEFTSEFMVEGDIELDECTGFDFINHHSTICCSNGASCKDFNAATRVVGGRVMAFLLGHGLHTIDHVLEKSSGLEPNRKLADALDIGIDGILRALGRIKDRFGGPVKSKSSRQATVRGALALYGYGKIAAARELIALLNSSKVFAKGLTELIEKHFGIRNWTLPE
jgi:hypothetical protein